MSKKYIIRENEVIYFSRKNGFITVPKTQHNYREIMDYLVSPEFKEACFIRMAGRKEYDIEMASKGRIKREKNGARLGRIRIPDSILARIDELKAGGYEFRHLEKFWDRCGRNPEPKSVEMLFEFLSAHNLTITEDGFFLAYKGVREDFKDVQTGAIDNSVGQTVTMPRDKVVFNPDAECSAGLHCGELAYARSWGPVVLLVKVDPGKVVSVPKHSGARKIRVCEYTVDSLYAKETPIRTAVVNRKTKKPVRTRTCRNTRWTPEEEALLRKAVEGSSPVNWKAVSGKLCRSADSCRKKYRTLPAGSTSTAGWSDERIEALRHAVAKSGKNWAEIAKALNTSAAACRSKWQRLNKY